jgi:uncharacterized protein YecT (DUF1311 family)
MKAIGLICVLLAAMQGVASAKFQMNAGADACNQYEQADKKMEATYNGIVSNKKYAQDMDFLVAFRDAHVQWIGYRNLQSRVIFPRPGKGKEFGSLFSRCECSLLRDLTNRHIEDMEMWIKGVIEGDVCIDATRQVQPAAPAEETLDPKRTLTK